MHNRFHGALPKKMPGLCLVFAFCLFPLVLFAQSRLGDVNNDSKVDIIDALLVAQYAAGLNPANFNLANADTDASSKVDIIDALLTARYAAGLISRLPGETATPTPTPTPSGNQDVFGITMLYPSLTGKPIWDARHWNNGIVRTLTFDTLSGRDPYDPTTWSQYHGNGTVRVDGQGLLFMGGGEPRIYINTYPGASTTNPAMFWKNVEVTVYYMRIGTDGANWGGLVIGARSGVDGHSGSNNCAATTYYARLRHDGSIDFEKELEHSASSVGISKRLFDGSPLPSNKWFGLKYCCYNINNDSNVKFEMYLESSGNGTGQGTWEKVLEYADTGNWAAPTSSCTYNSTYIVTTGGGVVFIRNTNAAEARYKMFTVREINVQ